MKPIFSAVILLALLSHGLTRPAGNGEWPRKFDEFGNINCEDELARLDAFAIELQNQPNLIGYVIIYGGRTGRRNEAKARAARMYYYLVRSRGMDRKRVVTVDGGFRETLMGELWLSKPGAPVPVATPTVRAEDVKLKGRVRIVGYNCGDAMGRV
ncbi:MAG TPA: hypothetical protein VGQ72_10040 [Pyrinomonadaceae bacterium]|jgi:hypothetical protein|nr:hypothetical protein [Pyrinomonadaceae bacterium]